MANKNEIEVIKQIVDRAEKKNLLAFDRTSLIMDLQGVDMEVGMRFEDLLEADEYNFSHDIVGIQNNFNRQELKLENFFLPRYAKNE